MRTWILALAVLTSHSAMALEPLLICKGKTSSGIGINVLIAQDGDAGMTGVLSLSHPNAAFEERVFHALSYIGGRHQYNYEGAGFKIRMDEFAEVHAGSPVAYNSELTQVFGEPAQLFCCASSSMTYPLEACKE
jgi:hypothetical protein